MFARAPFAAFAVVLIGCGGAAATAAPADDPAPAESAVSPDVRVRVADEAPVRELDPAISASMERAVRDAYTTTEQAETVRAEVVLHDLSTDEAGQLRGRVRVTLVRIGDERICTVLEGGATAAARAESSAQRVIEASLRAALRSFDRDMGECVASNVAP